MITTRLTRLTAALALGLTVAACGSTENPVFNLIKQLPQTLTQRDAKPQPITQEQIAAGLAATDKPISLITLETRKGQALMLEIERNRGYQSFATSSRQVVTIREGFMTSSRGLGGDLMSSEEDDLLALIQARKVGDVRYVQRHLTVDNQTTVRNYLCIAKPDEEAPSQLGPILEGERVVTVYCKDEPTYFTNSFIVDRHGNIRVARQWMGPDLGYLVAQHLRY
ncbi:MAG: YjbF family lipoprotein [Paracoccaceae bacterium]|nr:YjbF family lipoprotein [Paracoccaceae bacterium]